MARWQRPFFSPVALVVKGESAQEEVTRDRQILEELGLTEPVVTQMGQGVVDHRPRSSWRGSLGQNEREFLQPQRTKRLRLSDVSRETSASVPPLANPGLGWPDPTTLEPPGIGDPT